MITLRVQLGLGLSKRTDDHASVPNFDRRAIDESSWCEYDVTFNTYRQLLTMWLLC